MQQSLSEPPIVLSAEGSTEEARQPQPNPPFSKTESNQVTVAPNLSDLVSGKIETPEEEYAVRLGHRLNEVVHFVLTIGLIVSTVLILVGLGLDLLSHRQVPTSVPTFGEVFRLTAELRPSGFLTLGLLVMVATPILRVLGSTLAFIYERDWRYAAITCIVLLVVTLSLLLGQG